MNPTASLPARPRHRVPGVLALLALLALLAGGLVLGPLDLASPDKGSGVTDVGAPRRVHAPAAPTPDEPTAARRVVVQAPSKAATGEAHGLVTVFDEESPAVANLDPELLAALRAAATDARDDGVEFRVNSGWRSAAYQAQLLREAVAQYGSKAQAERWVATPQTSAHVSGDAVDLGPAATQAWLERHGAAYGLCRVYRNEPWHFELRPAAVDSGCPAMYADASQDPRMQR